MLQNLGPHMEQKWAVLCASLAWRSTQPQPRWPGHYRGFGVASQVSSDQRQGVVMHAGGGVALGQVGGVGGDLVGDDAVLDVLTVGQAQVLLGRDVADASLAAQEAEAGMAEMSAKFRAGGGMVEVKV